MFLINPITVVVVMIVIIISNNDKLIKCRSMVWIYKNMNKRIFFFSFHSYTAAFITVVVVLLRGKVVVAAV